MIFAADIGGTKCNLALFRRDGSRLELAAKRRYLTADFAAQPFEAMLARFDQDVCGDLSRSLAGVAIAGAGAVIDGTVLATYVPWKLDRNQLARYFEPAPVMLLNDVQASSLSVPHMADSDLMVINSGHAEPHATRALIAAGTGLGESLLVWNGNRFHALATEGGEADFAPHNSQATELLTWLRKRTERVSAEDVLSGSGFRLVHEFLAPTVTHESFAHPQRSAQEITLLAAERRCQACVDTVDFWIAAYGAEAGNLALRTLAYGGIYVAGGIAARIVTKLADGGFFRSFCDKGRFQPVLERIPLSVITNEDAPLWGAAYEALMQISHTT